MTHQEKKPLLLVDVDGVTNLFEGWVPVGEAWYDTRGRRHQRQAAPSHLKAARAAGYDLLLNPEHPEWFAKLEPLFDTVHATMWQEHVYEFTAVAGYGHDWSYIPFDDYHVPDATRSRIGNGVTAYKWPGLLDVIGDDPVAYVDDDLTPAQHQWARQRDAAGFPTLFIQPDPATGLTWEHVNELMAFADRVDADRLAA